MRDLPSHTIRPKKEGQAKRPKQQQAIKIKGIRHNVKQLIKAENQRYERIHKRAKGSRAQRQTPTAAATKYASRLCSRPCRVYFRCSFLPTQRKRHNHRHNKTNTFSFHSRCITPLEHARTRQHTHIQRLFGDQTGLAHANRKTTHKNERNSRIR